MVATRKTSGSDKPRRPPATTPEARENQLISLAFDLAEKQLREGTASSVVVSHYLKLGTAREGLERKKLMQENELLSAKVEAMASGARTEELYKSALDAMRQYAGQETEDDYDD